MRAGFPYAPAQTLAARHRLGDQLVRRPEEQRKIAQRLRGSGWKGSLDEMRRS